MLKLILCLLFASVWAQDIEIAPGLQIAEAVRELDLSTQIVKVSVTLDVQNTGTGSLKYIAFAIDKNHAPNVAFLDAYVLGKSEDDYKKLKTVKSTLKNTKSEAAFYRVDFAKVLGAGEKQKIKVDYQCSHMISPFPSHITQSEQQLVVYDGNLHVFSPYKITREKTVITLAGGAVESHTKSDAFKLEADTLTYGPYSDTTPFSESELRLHYENNAPFLVVNKLTRVVEISHWGNVAVEEYIDMEHAGALLKGSFSRFDYQRDHRGDKQPSVKSFKTVLPSAARDVYYRDEIGNISTSNLRSLDDAVQLEIRPRFPLFGGWKTHYYIGYNVPSYEYLFSSGNEFGLKMRFIDHIYDNFVVNEMTIKVILPEGAKNIRVDPPYKVKRDADETHYTYLDWSGRPVIIMHKNNLLEHHIQDFELQYTFERSALIFEPLMLIMAFYVLFLLVIIWVRFDFSIATDTASECRLKVQGMVEQLTDLHTQRLSSYDVWQEGVVKYKANKDSSTLNSQKKKTETEIKNINNQITNIQTTVKAESAEVADKIGELQRLDKAIRDHLTSFTQQTERLVGGKLNKAAYAESEKQFRAKYDEARDKMDGIVYAL